MALGPGPGEVTEPGRLRRRVAQVGLGLGLVAATAWPLASPSPPPVFDLRIWGTADGLPGSQVNAVAQDDDGSLWIGTLAGLVRFDGFSFELFDESHGGLSSSRITVLERGSQGRLWIGTEQGHLIEYRQGRFVLRAEPPYPASRIVSMTEDPAGILWIARYADPTREMQPLVWQYRPEDGGAGRLVPRRDLDRLWMAADRQGGAGILLHDGTVRPPPESSLVVALSRDTAGRVWGQMPLGRLVRLPDGLTDPAGEPYAGANELHRTLVTHATGRRVEVLDPVSLERLGSFAAGDGVFLWLVDRRGLLWVSDGQGRLSAFRGDEPEPVATFAVDAVLRDVTEDRDGNLWVGTLTRGLLRISESPVEVLGPERVPLPGAVGLTPQNELFVEPAPAGACYPLHLLRGERAETVGSACGWMLWDRRGTWWHFENGARGRRLLVGRPPVGPERRLEVHATWMLEDPDLDGVLWLVGERALMRLDTRLPGPLAVSASWPMAANRALASDGQGGLWIGATDGLWNLRAGQLAHFGKAEGLPVENVRAILPDGRGGLWLGTYGGGVVHFDGETFVALGIDRGLPEAVVSTLVADGFGGIWFAGNRGIHRLRRENLERATTNPAERLEVLSFGSEQGLENPETTGRPGLAGPDGRLWFATFGGLVAVDPRAIARREGVAPQVLLREVVSAPGKSAAGPPVEVGVGASRDLSVSFTAIHLASPELLAFRYRLDPLDSTWTDAGPGRTAVFRNLPPGEFHFRVQARHSSGVWSESGTVQSVVIRPRFRETGWFRLLLAALTLALLAAVWQLSTRQIRRRAELLERAVEERTVALAAERDVVARQAQRLGDLAEARSQFMAAISHELRTPLTLVLGPLQDLRDEELGELPLAAKRELDVTLRSAHRLRRLVDRLLGVARSEVALQRLHCVEADLSAFVRRLATELDPLAARRGSTLLVVAGDRPTPAWIDELQFESVVINLVANAIKHTPPGSTIELSVESGGGEVVLRVRDDGPGIPSAELPKLFERFYRGRAAAQDGAGGFGLGLALVREVVERHGGAITVASAPAGTTFTVRLRSGRAHIADADCAPYDPSGVPQREPALADAGTMAEVAPPDPPGAPGNGEIAAESDRTTVLVVDDNAELRSLVRRQIGDQYRVLEAVDSEEALATLAVQLPDLVLSDVMMPGLDGYALCRAIRADPAIDFIPIVLLTAKASVDARVEGLDEGADAYLAKPFDARVLRATLAGLLASRRRLRDRYAAQAVAAAAASPAKVVSGEPTGADGRYLRRLREAIDARLHEEEFAVDDLARAVGQSRVSLFRHVRRLLGVSPSDLLREARLERADRLLRAREGNVSEVAYAVGFKSTAHFSNAFLARFGTRPSSVAGSREAQGRPVG